MINNSCSIDMSVNQTIELFTNTLIKRDGQRNNLFKILALNTKALSLTEEDMVYIKTGQLPARSNPTANMQYMGMNFPYNTSTVQYTGNDDYSLQFIFDAAGEIRSKFERASRIIFNDLSTTGDWRVPTLSDIMTIAPLDNQYNPSAYYHFYGVAFKGMDAVEFQIAEGDGQIVNITAHISYYYYKGPGSDTVYTGS